jgi:hypothetical protein
MTIKLNGNKSVLRFGDFIVAAYQARGRRKANELIRRAVNMHLVEFRGPQRVVITED